MKIKHAMVGDTKILTKFLWFPCTIEYETRWLEKASWKEEYCSYRTYRGYFGYWKRMEWL